MLRRRVLITMLRAFENPNAVIQPQRRHPGVVFLQELRRLLNDPYAGIIRDRGLSQRGRDEEQQVTIAKLAHFQIREPVI